MTVKNPQALKKLTYVGLSLASMSFSLEAKAGVSDGLIDQPVIGGRIKVPFIGKDMVGELEKKLKLLFEEREANPEDDVQRDLKSPPMGNIGNASSSKYAELKNKIIDKYEKDNPKLARFKNSSQVKHSSPDLAAQAQEFARLAENLKNKMQEEDKKASEVGKAVVSGSAFLAETMTVRSIEDPYTINKLRGLFNGLKDNLTNFFDEK